MIVATYRIYVYIEQISLDYTHVIWPQKVQKSQVYNTVL